MKITRIHQLAVHVHDLDEAVSFYETVLQAKFIGRFDPPGLAFFDFSGVRLLLEKGSPNATIYFWVDDIDFAYAELVEKGISFTSEPQLINRDGVGLFGEPNQEEWMAFFNDPSGNTLAIASRKKNEL